MRYYLYYKKPEWPDWVFVPCDTEEERDRLAAIYREEGYQVRT